MKSQHSLKCAETWAGNGSTSSIAELPGLRVWVHSRAFGASDAGGDVHYVSVCPNCIVSRVALADVSGHGRAVQSMGSKLRELMQKHLAALEQVNLMSDLNEAVLQELDGIHYATMVAVGFHGRRGLLVMTNAGHPPALWYRVDRGDWEWLAPQRAETAAGIRGTPLGLLPHASYPRMIVKPKHGDLIVLYSDGISEAKGPDGEELGRDRLMAVARAVSSREAESFGAQMVDAIDAFRKHRESEDDETIIVLQPFPERSS